MPWLRAGIDTVHVRLPLLQKNNRWRFFQFHFYFFKLFFLTFYFNFYYLILSYFHFYFILFF